MGENQIRNIVNDLIDIQNNVHTGYFEAKPQRAVGLEEVQALVVPNDMDIALKQELIDKSFNVIEYDPNI